jgi:hypothetical protein
VRPDVVLVTHEYRDHNGIGALDGDAPVFDTDALPPGSEPLVVVPAAP